METNNLVFNLHKHGKNSIYCNSGMICWWTLSGHHLTSMLLSVHMCGGKKNFDAATSKVNFSSVSSCSNLRRSNTCLVFLANILASSQCDNHKNNCHIL